MSDNKHGFGWNGKGYYIALILCAAAIGITSYVYERNQRLSTQTQLQATQAVQTATLETGADVPAIARIAGLENNIYLQTGLIMLIGLLAKTAILLTEYAAERRKAGMGLIASAVSAAKARFRPILMTVLTMIFGLFPLVVATGVGANGNRSLGTGVVGGMFIGTLALLFIVPVLFISFQWLQERLRPAQSVPTSDWQIEEEMKVSRKEIEESH